MKSGPLPSGEVRALPERPRVLLLDDGELGRIRQVLRPLGVELTHLRGEVGAGDLEAPHDVVFATVRRTLALEGTVDLAALPGKPVWIAVHGQDFLPLRVRLRKLGVSFLVQTSVGSEALRLLLLHTLHRGPDRRDGPRLPVGAKVACRDETGRPFAADLLDLHTAGCRLLAAEPRKPGEALMLDLPPELAGGEKLVLAARVARVEPSDGASGHRLGLEFRDVSPEARELVDAILAGKVIGTVVTRLGEELSEEVAPLTVRSPEAETPVPSPPPRADAPRRGHARQNRRVEYAREVTALVGSGSHVILARDLSIAGMRAEPLPELALGAELELALYGMSGAEPVLVRAVVARDDGEAGTVFRFTAMEPGERRRLEKIIAGAPEIESLRDGSAGGVVLTRILPRDR